MPDDVSDRFLGGAVVSILGSVLATVTLFDIYEDFVLQGDPLYLSLLENSLPLVFDLSLVVAGWVLVTGRMPYAVSARRITGWSLFGGSVVLVITAWVYYFQILQGAIKAHVIFSHVVAMGAIAGLAVGIYDGRRTEREAELRVERDRTSTLFENSSDCIAAVEFVDDRPVIRRINETFSRTFGVAPADVIGQCLDDVIVPPERDDRADEINQKARASTYVEDRVLRTTASGERRVFRLQAIPLECSDAETDSYAIYTDITDQHRYEARMTALHDATREIMDAESVDEITDRAVRAADDVLDLHITGIHLYSPETDRLEPAVWTDTVAELIGEPTAFDRGDAIAWSVFESGTSEYVPDVHDRSTVHNDDSPIRSEILLPLDRWGVMMIGSQAVDAFDDSHISLAKTLAANVEAAMDRAERQEELKRQNERLDTFASVVSHDLRNPLSVASGFLEVAREGDRDAFDRIERSLERMDERIDTLLTLARSGEEIGETTAAQLAEVATAAWNSVDTANATLVLDTDRRVDADVDRLGQLFENLFRNSLDHTGEDVTIRVTDTAAGFAVADDGDGIPEPDRDAVFTHGYTTDEDGTGLGLAIVSVIVDAHGWAVSVGESAAGGAQFEFTL